MSAAPLFDSGDAQRWGALLDGYWQAVESLGKDKLLDLDRYHKTGVSRPSFAAIRGART
jgi:hypothetical protein